LEGTVYAVLSSLTIFVLNGILGAGRVGGLRAAQSIFAPLTLILPAISLPGLPALVRALAVSPKTAIALAGRLSAAVSLTAAVYVGAMVVLGGRVVPYVFGGSFDSFTGLAVPLGAWQLVGALGTGFGLFLTAKERGRDIFTVLVAGAVSSTAFVTLLAWASGVTGAAWGFAAGAAVTTTLYVALSLRAHAPSPSDDGTHSGAAAISDR
jgi:O-antigen/teichoic acid export membrane protein